MKKNKIKDTGLEVTELSFGTSSLGSMPDTYGYEVPEQRAQETLKRFFQGPVNMLDTSRNYAMGESEKRIGTAIKENCGWPEKFVLSTKIDRNMDTLVFDEKRTRESFEDLINRVADAETTFDFARGNFQELKLIPKAYGSILWLSQA